MARALRIQYRGAYYHVTCRGNERREMYKDDKERKQLTREWTIRLRSAKAAALSETMNL